MSSDTYWDPTPEEFKRVLDGVLYRWADVLEALRPIDGPVEE